MTLVVAHQILIAAAIAMSVLFGVRGIAVFTRSGNTSDLAIGVASLVVAAVLSLYLRSVRATWLAARASARKQ